MKTVVHNILGTPYTVKFGTKEELNITEEYMGECRVYSKEILICIERGGCTDDELREKTKEILAHEIFHAYLNESGVEIEEEVEEKLATFFMKNWGKMSKSMIELFYDDELNNILEDRL